MSKKVDRERKKSMNQRIVKEGRASALPTPSTHTKAFPNAIPRTTQELDKLEI
jgi:hypothetical protein